MLTGDMPFQAKRSPVGSANHDRAVCRAGNNKSGSFARRFADCQPLFEKESGGTLSNDRRAFNGRAQSFERRKIIDDFARQNFRFVRQKRRKAVCSGFFAVARTAKSIRFKRL
jgi:hypothetical protein